MKAKRWISLLLAVSMMLGVLAMPALAATQQPESTAVVSEELPDAAALSAAEDFWRYCSRQLWRCCIATR